MIDKAPELKPCPVAEAITEHWGGRCPDYEQGCPICDAWAEYDRPTADLHVKVKPLEFRDSYGVIRADTPFGSYKIAGKILHLPSGASMVSENPESDANERHRETILAALEPAPITPLQDRVDPWMQACFGPKISADKMERNHRFLEEALELVQSLGCTKSEAIKLVDYVYGRPEGEPHQEVGGVMITLAALCLANGLEMDKAGEDELKRIWTKVDKIRAKQAAKPKNSPLPQYVEPAPMTPAEGWQPIETAPKDGTTVLLYTTAKLNGLSVSVTPSMWDDEFGWCGRSANDEAILAKVQPTHWMPLPKPPIAEGESE